MNILNEDITIYKNIIYSEPILKLHRKKSSQLKKNTSNIKIDSLSHTAWTDLVDFNLWHDGCKSNFGCKTTNRIKTIFCMIPLSN